MRHTLEHKADKVMCFKAMIHPNNERVVKLCTDFLLVFDDIFLLVLANELLEHHLHGIKLSVAQAANKIDLAKTTDSQALEHLILLEPSFCYKLYASKGHLLCFQPSLSDWNAVIKQQIAVSWLEANHKGSLEERIGVFILKQEAEDMLMEDIGDVLGLHTDWQPHL